MPQLGETVTEGTITRWLKQVGDAVAVDDVLFEVSTDKVDTEVPSAHAGVLAPDPRARGRDRARSARRWPSSPTPPTRPLDGGGRAASAAPAAPSRRAGRPRVPAAPASRTGQCPQASPSGRDRHRADGTGSCRPWCGRCWPSTGWRPATSSGTGRDGRITRSDVLAAAANRRAATAAAAPARRPHGRWPTRRADGRGRRRGHRVHPGPAQHGRAHGALAGDVGPHAGGDRGRLPRASTPSGGRPGCRSCPFVARAVDRRHRRVPARERLGGRRRADRAPAHPPRRRRRRRLRGARRAGRAATPAAKRLAGARRRRSADLAAKARSQAADRRRPRPAARSPSRTSGPTARS